MTLHLMHLMRHCIILPCCLLAITFPTYADNILYVDDDAAPGGHGGNWNHALRFLQDALAIASAPDSGIDEIRVAQGIYRSDRSEAFPKGTGDRLATFHLLDNLAIRGGYAGTKAAYPHDRDYEMYETILSGDLAGDDEPEFINIEENCFNVVTASFTDRTAILEGFTITAGHANGDASPTDNDRMHWIRGAGLWNQEGSPTVLHCRFLRNTASRNGGGMYNLYESGAIIRECSFEYNRALNLNGGGLHNWSRTRSQEEWVLVDSCVFIGNSAADLGGGMLNFNNETTITNCRFYNNSARAGGGFYNRASLCIVRNCDVENNNAEFGGGIMLELCNDDIEGIRVCNNMAEREGGGVFVGEDPSIDALSEPLTIASSEICNNVAPMGGGIMVRPARLFKAVSTQGDEVSYRLSRGSAGTEEEVLPNLILRKCWIQNNHSESGGGLMVINDFGVSIVKIAVSVIDSHILSNVSEGNGGGVLSESYGLFFDSCTINDNQAGLNGGAIYNDSSNCRLVATQLLRNHTQLRGGGVFNRRTISSITRCVFASNTVGSDTEGRGGALFSNNSSLEFFDSLFTLNRAGVFGGAIMQINGDIKVTNCTFIDNEAGTGGAVQLSPPPFAGEGSFANSIFWANVGGGISGGEADNVRVDFSDVMGGWSGAGSGNIDQDPRFVDPDGPDDDPETFDDNDYRLSSDSPAVDKGSNKLLPTVPVTDLDGNLRIIDGDTDGFAIVDMGAYEFDPSCPADLNGDGIVDVLDLLRVVFALGSQGAVPEDLDGDGVVTFGDMHIIIRNFGPCSVITSGCPADLDNNNVVNVTDLLMFLSTFGPCPDPQDSCPPDLDHDGDVDVTDLLALLAAWGSCP